MDRHKIANEMFVCFLTHSKEVCEGGPYEIDGYGLSKMVEIFSKAANEELYEIFLVFLSMLQEKGIPHNPRQFNC